MALTSMRPFVDLEVLRPGKHLSTSREGAGKWLLSRMDPDVVHQFVLGLEYPTLGPEASNVVLSCFNL